MNNLVKVTEVDVDGCGSDASEYVLFDMEPSMDDIRELKKCLDWAKGQAGADDDTAAIIETALERFNELYPRLRGVLHNPGIVEIQF